MLTERLLKMIDAFEDIYRETGAMGGIEIGANVEFRFVATTWRDDEVHPGGLIVCVDKNTPIAIEDSSAGMIARVAQELPRLAEILDKGAQTIEAEVVKGEYVLGAWFESRGLSV